MSLGSGVVPYAVDMFVTDFGNVEMTAEESAAYRVMLDGDGWCISERFLEPYLMLQRLLTARARTAFLG